MGRIDRTLAELVAALREAEATILELRAALVREQRRCTEFQRQAVARDEALRRAYRVALSPHHGDSQQREA